MRQTRSHRRSSRVTLGVLSVVMVGLVGCDLLGLGDDGEGDDDGPSPIIGNVATTDVVGRGYNALGNYADPRELRARVLNLDALVGDDRVDRVAADFAEFRTISGTSISEYADSFSTRVSQSVGFKGFGGSIEVNYEESSYERSENSFATVQSVIQKQTDRITLVTADALAPYLEADFLANLNDSSVAPANLFSVYGTHVLLSVVLGARLDFSYAVDMVEMETSQSVSVLAQTSMSFKLIEASQEFEREDSELARRVDENSETRLVLYGGQAEFGQSIINDSNYDRWVDSIEGRETLVDFGNDNAILPVWEFADSPTRRQELEDFFIEQSDGIFTNLQEQPFRVEVQLVGLRADSVEDQGGGLEMFGTITTSALDNGVSIQNVELWNVNEANATDNLRAGQTFNIGSRTILTFPEFDEIGDSVFITGTLTEGDNPASPGGGDDPFGTQSSSIFVRDGLRGEKTLTWTVDDSTVVAIFAITVI